MIEIIEPSVELIAEHDPLKKIELCGRICYKSEDKICDGSAERLIKAMIKRGHESVLEHFQISIEDSVGSFINYCKDNEYYKNPINIKYDRILFNDECDKFAKFLTFNDNVVTSNIRGWRNFFKFCDNSLVNNFKKKYQIFFDDIDGGSGQYDGINIFENPDYYTVRIITSRGITHELVRHRVFSFSQESTRYCNYGGSPMKFIRPIPFEWANREMSDEFRIWRNACSRSCIDYNEMIECGCTPQMARDVLNNSLKTEIMMTGTMRQWDEFFKLRCDKTAHPEMIVIAEKIKAQF